MALGQVGNFSPKVTVNKLEFLCNKKIPIAAFNPIVVLNLEVWYIIRIMQFF